MRIARREKVFGPGRAVPLDKNAKCRIQAYAKAWSEMAVPGGRLDGHAAGSDGPVCVLTFQSLGPRVDPETFSRAPYFRPLWRPDILGRRLDADVDWRDITKLVTASYCLLAPKKLAEAVRSEQSADRETRSQGKERQQRHHRQ